jgi:lysophospholipase L1-like esterase
MCTYLTMLSIVISCIWLIAILIVTVTYLYPTAEAPITSPIPSPITSPIISSTTSTTSTLFITTPLKSSSQSSQSSIVSKLNSGAKVVLVFHGHSIPATYNRPCCTSYSYPYLVREDLKKKFPKANISVVVTAKSSENSKDGSSRFRSDVLSQSPDILFIDYGINDGPLGSKNSEYWNDMIQLAKSKGIPVVILTNTGTHSSNFNDPNDYMAQIANRIRLVAIKQNAILADNFKVWGKKAHPFIDYVVSNSDAHPNPKGHRLIADCIFDALIESNLFK